MRTNTFSMMTSSNGNIGRIRLSVSRANRTYELSGIIHVTLLRKYGKYSTGPCTYGPWVRTYSKLFSCKSVLTVCSYRAQSNEIYAYGRVSRGSLPRVRRYGLLYLRTIEYDHFPRYWPFVRGTPLTKASDAGIWCFLYSVSENGWVNNRDASDLRRNRAHYDITTMHFAFSLERRALAWLKRQNLKIGYDTRYLFGYLQWNLLWKIYASWSQVIPAIKVSIPRPSHTDRIPGFDQTCILCCYFTNPGCWLCPCYHFHHNKRAISSGTPTAVHARLFTHTFE